MNTPKLINELRREIARHMRSHTKPNVIGTVTRNAVESHLRTYLSAGVWCKDAITYLQEDRGPFDKEWCDLLGEDGMNSI